MNSALAIFVVVGFAATIEYFDLPAHARAVMERSRESLEVIRDSSRTDLEKEEALQRHAKRLFVLLGILAGGSVLALGVPLGAVWILDRLGIGSFEGTLFILQRIDFLLGTVVAGGLAYYLVQQFR